ncbi:IucA/IucC family protein [Streptomyces rubrolavendulae]|uniref:N(2)-citryl-N(6)-acetyl-N(6)-hydroxylysine synthase n=1 Tax=Streptomyces rubrolavendulae TaxID=285473 RepID=A0A1D8G8V0_9ACTN|nr:IucA/IucC family protein [Streptomyces rubrolavendulae]AOT61879.1 N(2)-citryl-N(6)-acetyl-N(6)-hydroxylysine synthase [Streptomyces rubrolavendulae]
MSQTQPLDPAAEADRAAVDNLLRCWVRETGVERPADGVLRLELAAAGTAVEAPVRYWSAVGWHRFGTARLPSGAPACATALAALLGVEAAGGDPESVADLTGRVADSVRRVTGFVRARAAVPGDPAGTTPFLAAEQALLTGHPLHPTPKSREGLTEAEGARYSPETRGAFPLHWFAADPAVVSSDSSLGRSAADLLASLAGDAPARPEGTVLVPAHPWQARDAVHRPAVRALLDAGLLHDLGPAGPAWSPTSSVRTVYRADAPVMLKFSLGLRITNSRRENMRAELHRGLAVDRLLTAGLEGALQAAHPGFGIVRDPAWLAVDPAPVGTGHGSGGGEGEGGSGGGGGGGGEDGTGLDVVVRANPFAAGAAPQALCVAGLVAPRPDLPGGRSHLAALVHALAERTGRPVAEAAEEWFTRYTRHVVAPVLWLHAVYGLGLEAHQQNTLVVLDADGLPAGGRYRDNQGYYFSPARSGALYRWVPGVGRDLGTYAADEVIDERLAYYVGVNNLLGVVGALGSQGLADEARLLAVADRFLAGAAAEHGDRLRLASLLRDEPVLRCKANLLTRVRGMDELTGPLEAQSVYVDIANPLVEVRK